MDEAQRLAYLRAMGIAVWRPRHDRALPQSAPIQVVAAQQPSRLDTASQQSVAHPLSPSLPARQGVRGEDCSAQRLSASHPDSSPVEAAMGAAGNAVALMDSSDGRNPSPAITRPDSSIVEHPASGASMSALEVGGGVESMDWDRLEDAVRNCRACVLCESRRQTVFGVGSRTAELMLVGEAPGADEDREGEPFVGRAGKLLTRMLKAIGLDRDQVYIANVLKCRPPGNRDPRVEEIQHCAVYLSRQIELIEPSLILSVGRIAAHHLLATDAPVGRLRGRWFEFGPSAIPLRVTYHPAYLLRSPEQKAKAWDDLTAVVRRLEQCKRPSRAP